jgi:hypothetical protein
VVEEVEKPMEEFVQQHPSLIAPFHYFGSEIEKMNMIHKAMKKHLEQQPGQQHVKTNVAFVLKMTRMKMDLVLNGKSGDLALEMLCALCDEKAMLKT